MAHSHSTNHSHTEKTTRFLIAGIILNAVYVLIETIYGLLTNSMSLLADAGHNLSDVLGLALALAAAYLVRRKGSRDKTYGYRKSSILAAMFNALLLLVAIGALGYESINRIFEPKPVEGSIIIIVAGIGVLINFSTALLFVRDKERDLNIRGAYIHMAADAAVSLGVVISGVLISYSGKFWIDPVVSIIVMIVIFQGTWGLLKESFNLAMDSVPPSIDADSVEEYLLKLEGVSEIHDLHIWGMSTTETALTVHIVKSSNRIDDDFTKKISETLHEKFGIAHSTIQFETGDEIMRCADCGNGN